MEIYSINQSYIEYLSKFDKKVCLTKKNLPFGRKYIGIVLQINSFLYFAPLSSKVTKFNQITKKEEFRNYYCDVYLKNKKNEYLGAIKLNNMIPIITNKFDTLLGKIEISKLLSSNDKKIKMYGNLLKNQRDLLNSKIIKDQIFTKSKNIYKSYLYKENLKKICCDFKKLEKEALNFNL